MRLRYVYIDGVFHAEVADIGDYVIVGVTSIAISQCCHCHTAETDRHFVDHSCAWCSKALEAREWHDCPNFSVDYALWRLGMAKFTWADEDWSVWD